MACPVCKSDQFYIKDPDDAYETYDFQCRDGQIQFEDPAGAPETEDVKADREIFCQRCAWHGPFNQV